MLMNPVPRPSYRKSTSQNFALWAQKFIKLTQAPFMNYDISMYDESSYKQCEPMNMTLHEEMAQIKYIFADKTGTLTANIM